MKFIAVLLLIFSAPLFAETEYTVLQEFEINSLPAAASDSNEVPSLGYNPKPEGMYFKGPSAITANSNQILIMDSHNSRILSYSLKDGTNSTLMDKIESESVRYAFNLLNIGKDTLASFMPPDRLNVISLENKQIEKKKIMTSPGFFIETFSLYPLENDLFYCTNTADLYVAEGILENNKKMAVPKRISADIKDAMEMEFSPSFLPHLQNYTNFYNYWVTKNPQMSPEAAAVARNGVFNMYIFSGRDSDGTTYWADNAQLHQFDKKGEWQESISLFYDQLPVYNIAVSPEGRVFGLAYSNTKALLIEMHFTKN